jgi:NAD(P)-dependent dehydrogenase (short-subunit alcohol dehydrogenase family)
MKTVIITGANSGLGLWTTKYLLEMGYFVIMACRNIEKAQNAIDSFPELKLSSNYAIKKLDLGDFDSIRHFVADLTEFPEIYALDCNAGITYSGDFQYTKNGIEATFGTNHLGHFLFSNLLLEKYSLAKIVIISSALHDPKNKSPFAKAVFRSVDQLAHPKLNTNTDLKKTCEEFYATSKLCNILFAHELEKRLKMENTNQNICINTVNPGLMLSTNFGRNHKPWEKIYRKALNFIFKIIGLADSPVQSAKVVVNLIDIVTKSGEYYDRGKVVASSTDSYDKDKALKLWQGSELLVGSKFLNKN